MIIKNPEKYDHIGFSISHLKDKKYDAILRNKITKKIKLVPFGSKNYQQYKDIALGYYSNLNHLDKKRRDHYRARHNGEQKNKYSSGFWSWYYLW